MNSKLVIFDCDGVLVDSEKLGNNALAEMLAIYGHQTSGHELEGRFRGMKLVESLRIPFCVASSGPRKKIEENLQTTNLYTHFDGKIFSGYELNSWKPDPGLFLAAARHFAVAPRDCVVVEDSFVGVSAGVAANMTVLALGARVNDKSLAAADKRKRHVNGRF